MPALEELAFLVVTVVVVVFLKLLSLFGSGVVWFVLLLLELVVEGGMFWDGCTSRFTGRILFGASYIRNINLKKKVNVK